MIIERLLNNNQNLHLVEYINLIKVMRVTHSMKMKYLWIRQFL